MLFAGAEPCLRPACREGKGRHPSNAETVDKVVQCPGLHGQFLGDRGTFFRWLVISFLTTEATLEETTSQRSSIPARVMTVVTTPIRVANFLFSINRIKSLPLGKASGPDPAGRLAMSIIHAFRNFKNSLLCAAAGISAHPGGSRLPEKPNWGPGASHDSFFRISLYIFECFPNGRPLYFTVGHVG